MASETLNPESFVDRIRLLVGDYILNEPMLPDSIYVWLYNKHNNNETLAAIEALESIINNIALSPSRWSIGDSSEWGANLPFLQQRLVELKRSLEGVKVPVILKSDRTNWNDFNKVFGEN